MNYYTLAIATFCSIWQCSYSCNSCRLANKQCTHYTSIIENHL